jgi:integrase
MPRRRHFGSVRKLPSGRYQASYWHEGDRHVAADTFAGKTDAQAWLSAKETDINRGQWVDPGAGKVTFGEFANGWLERQRHLRPRTLELYTYLLRDYLSPTFSKRSLSAITLSEVTAWHNELAGRRPQMAPKAYRLLAQLMRAATADGYIVKSPVAVKSAARERVAKRPVPTVAEVDALASAVPEPFKAMVLLAAWCALRFGELAALRRERVDLLHGEVIVTETVTELATGERLVGPPKTDAGRRAVAIPPNVLPAVERHLASIGPSPDTLLFAGADGGYLRRGHFYHQTWTPAWRTTGTRFRFHDLRHAGLTWAAAQGATIAELMHRAGHASPRAAMLYQHATRDRDHAIAEAMAKLAEPAQVVALRRDGGGTAK